MLNRADGHDHARRGVQRQPVALVGMARDHGCRRAGRRVALWLTHAKAHSQALEARGLATRGTEAGGEIRGGSCVGNAPRAASVGTSGTARPRLG